MVDPLSVTVNLLTIIQVCTKTAQTIDHLVKKYRDAPSKLVALQSESLCVSITLDHVSTIFKNNAALARSLDTSPQLRTALDSTLTGCLAIYKLLEKDLLKIQVPLGGKLGWKKRGYMLFNEEMIETYFNQIRGHLQGLNLLINCLQIESVATIETILQERIFAQIAQDTQTIRSQNKELDLPDSIYDGKYLEDEDKEFSFDDEVINSRAYREALKAARRNSALQGSVFLKESGEYPSDPYPRESSARNIDLIPGASTAARYDHFNSGIRLTDFPVVTTHDPNEDLIDLKDEPEQRSRAGPSTETTQALHQLVTALTLKDGRLDGGRRRDSAVAHLTEIPSFTYQQAGALAGVEGRVRTTSRNKFHVSHEGEEEILVSNGNSSRLRWSDQAPSLSSAITATYHGPLPRTHSITTAESSPVFPESASLLARQGSYFGFKSVSLGSEIALMTDDEHEKMLLDNMQSSLSSKSEEVQLKWVEDVLRHLRISANHEATVSKRRFSNTSISAPDKTLRSVATQLVDALVNSNNGQAMFLKARWIETFPELQQDLFVKASHRSYYRAYFYLGRFAEVKNDIKEAYRLYKIGESVNDSACIHRLARAAMEGTLGLKKSEKEGLMLLDIAAAAADTDYPDSLYHLATIQSTATKSSRISLPSKRPVPKDLSMAFNNINRAAFLGHPQALFHLGLIHRAGKFVPLSAKSSSSTTTTEPNPLVLRANANLALHYFGLAARRGVAQADYEIANTLFWGGDKSLLLQYQREAYLHAQRAYRAGIRESCLLIGTAYEDGVGVEQDVRKSLSWYLKGAAAGDPQATVKVDMLKKQGEVGIRAS